MFSVTGECWKKQDLAILVDMDCVAVHVVEKDISHSGFKVFITWASGIVPPMFTQTESRFFVVVTQEGG